MKAIDFLDSVRRLAVVFIFACGGGWASGALCANSNAAGTISGQFQTSPGGAATYSMPLELPPGPGGMTPQLAVVYSSQVADTYLSPGVAVNGFSQIARCPGNLEDDGAMNGVTFTSTDRFCIDGQRLVPASGVAYGSVGAYYHTEIESFLQAQSVAGSAGAPDHWVVTTKAGITMTYGQQYKFTVKGAAVKTLVWLLERSEDSVGNHIDYTYTLPSSTNNYDGAYFPSTISYGGNLNQSTPGDIVVKFNYQTPVGYWPTGYIHGQIIDWNQQLSSIQVSNADDSSGKYPTWKFSYLAPSSAASNSPDSRPVLTSVQKCQGSSCSNPTLFTYTNPVGAVGASSFPNIATGKSTNTTFTKLVGDMDGDGKGDLIGYSAYGGTVTGVIWRGSNPSGALVEWTTTGVNGGYYNSGQAVGDFNGDGISDIADIAVLNDQITVYAWTGNPNGAVPTVAASYSAGAPPSGWASCTQGVVTQMLSGDFNGDGLDDLFIVYTCSKAGSYGEVAATTWGQLLTNVNGKFVASTGFVLASETASGLGGSGYNASPLRTAYVADMNGDGIADIVTAIPPNQFLAQTFPFNVYFGASSTNSLAQSIVSSSAFTGYGFVDANADGVPDLVLTGQNGTTGTISAYLNDGTGNFVSGTLPIATQSFTLPTSTPYSPTFADINGDGYADVLLVESGTGTHNVVPIYSSGSRGFTIGASFATSTSSGNPITALAYDRDGDGLAELVTWWSGNQDNTGNIYSYHFQGIAHAKASTITSGLGATVSISYKPLTDTIAADPSGGVYVPAAAGTQTFPIKPVVGAMYVVSKTTISNPGHPGRASKYVYYGGRVDPKGRGFLGFSEVDCTDVTDTTFGITGVPSIKQVTTYSQQFPYDGLALGQTTIDLANNLTLSASTTTYKVTSPTAFPNAYFSYPATTIGRTYEISSGSSQVVTTTETTNTYGDDYGDLTAFTTTIYTGDVGGTPSYTTQTTSTFAAANTTSWIIGRLSQAVVTHSATGTNNIVRTSAFGYDPTTHLLSYEIVEPNDTSHLYSRTDYVRDGFGNITSATVSGKDITSRSTTSTFSSAAPYYGRFKTQECNTLNQCHTYTYSPATGNALTDTDANGMTTTYSYDDYGRPAGSTVNQNGLTVSGAIARSWCVNQPSYCNNASTGVYYVLTSTSTGSESVVVYDANERVVRKAGLIFDGSAANWIETLTTYDAVGRPYQVSSPRFANSSNTFWTTTTYDDLSRPVVVTAPSDQNHPTGSVVSTSYSGLSTTTTNARSYKTTRVLNAAGKIASATDADNATINYLYDAQGNLTSSTDSASHTTSIQYDIRGRKTKTIDPDMGTWTYTPDSLGEMVQQTDAKSNVVTIAYDLLGRMKQRTELEDTTAWVYDTLWKGALTSETITKAGGGTTYSRSMAYTPFGAVKTDTTIIDGNSYVLSYAYDVQGRVSQTTYPQGFAVAAHYNAQGSEDELYVPGNTSSYYWKGVSWDEWGQTYLETYGSAVQTMYNRDSAVGKINTIDAGSAGTLVDLSYSWDANGNTSQRIDGARNNLTENFVYDAVDRLKTDTVVSGSTTAIVYDNLGNISSKTGVGSYTYGGTRPHAVTSAGSNSYSYDANGNLMSGAGRTYTWSSYNMPLTLSASNGSSTFEYGPSREKVRQIIQQNGSMPTTVDYVGGGLFEAYLGSSGSAYKSYIVAPTGVIGIVTQSSSQSDSIAYLHHDAQGSSVVMTDKSGNLVQRIAYDAFGQRTSVSTAIGLSGFQFDQGYTGHLQLDNLNLIHMNGRVFDPVLARFLSPDPNVQDPNNLQSWNRYSYAWNNPLTFTDPSGYFLSGFFHWLGHNWETIAAIVITVVAAYCGVEGVWGLNAGEWAAAGGFAAGLVQSNGNVEDGLIGSAEAFAFYEVGGQFPAKASDLTTEQLIAKVALHGYIGGLAAAAEGGRFGSGFLSAAVPESASLATGDYGADSGHDWGVSEKIGASAVIGGSASVLGGGKFANGAVSGAFSEAFNDTLHMELEAHLPSFAQKYLCGSFGTCSGTYTYGLAVSYPGVTDAPWDLGVTKSSGFSFGLDFSNGYLPTSISGFFRQIFDISVGKNLGGFSSLSGTSEEIDTGALLLGKGVSIGPAPNFNYLGTSTKAGDVGLGASVSVSNTCIHSLRQDYGC